MFMLNVDGYSSCGWSIHSGWMLVVAVDEGWSIHSDWMSIDAVDGDNQYI